MSWFSEWAQRHATVFGLATEANVNMLLSWEDLFAAAGYSAAELHAATGWLAVNAPPRFPSDHLPALVGRVRASRAVAYGDDGPADHPLGNCATCDGIGRVIVPHPRGIRNGEWVPITSGTGGNNYHTVAVLCSCALGRWLAERCGGNDHRPDPLCLADYERNNPRWRVQMHQRQRERAAELALDGPGPLEATFKRLRATFARQRERNGGPP